MERPPPAFSIPNLSQRSQSHHPLRRPPANRADGHVPPGLPSFRRCLQMEAIVVNSCITSKFVQKVYLSALTIVAWYCFVQCFWKLVKSRMESSDSLWEMTSSLFQGFPLKLATLLSFCREIDLNKSQKIMQITF